MISQYANFQNPGAKIFKIRPSQKNHVTVSLSRSITMPSHDGCAAGSLPRALFQRSSARTRVTRCASLFAPLREESSFLNDCDRSRLLMLFPRVIPQMCSRSSSPQLKTLWQKAFAGSFGYSGTLLDASPAFHLRAVSSLAFPPVGPFCPNCGPQLRTAFAVQFKSVNIIH